MNKQSAKKRAVLVLLGFLFALQVFDILSTNYTLAMHDGVVEANPVIRYFMDRYGDAWYLPKLALMIMTILIALFVPRVRTLTFVVTGLVIAFYVLIVVNNIFAFV
jgi:hypothetical protein